MDEALANEVWAEAARDNFYEAVSQRNWSLARAVLKDMEDMKINTYVLRREMNIAMSEQVEGEDTRDGVAEDDRENEEREVEESSSLSNQEEAYGGY